MDKPDSAEQQFGQDELEAEYDFWSISGSFISRNHFQERQKLHVPQEVSLLIPLKQVDVIRRTNTTLDVLRECQIDHWNVNDGRHV